ncbi:MAG: hypothetical protein HQL77_00805 [Magnetococcales bacterium]|nr:hypothetical protein [Magnetococcales bacterium]
MAILEANLKRDIEFIRRDMKEMEQRLVIKLGGILLVAVGVIFTLIKIL